MLFFSSSIRVALRFVLSLCSAAVLGYALESFVDVWSSILVLWRFWGDGSCEAAAAMMRREKYASFGISLSVRNNHRHKICLKLQCDCLIFMLTKFNTVKRRRFALQPELSCAAYA
jgi:hypothetical protein